jgi:hypothetical protein
MDWSSLAPIVAGFAPKLAGLLGTAIGGPLGGVVGTIAGNAIAGALGVAPTPAAVGAAVQNDPAAQAKIEKLEAEHADALIQQAQVQIAALTQAGETARANSDQIGQSMRAEVGTVSWWHWRNLIGYLVLLYGLQQIGMIWISALYPKMLTPADAANLFNATTIFTGGLFALLGYVASDTTDRYKTAITGDRGPVSLFGTIKNAIAGGRKP